MPRLLLTAAAFAVLFCGGCGQIGDPMPPLANIPAPVDDLSASQRGSTIVVQFSMPELTTEGMVIRRPVKLDLRVGPAAEQFDANEWSAQAKQFAPEPVGKGPVRHELTLAEEWTGSEVVIAVKIIGENGRDAGWSNFDILPVVAAPERPQEVRSDSVAGGVRLAWRANGQSFRVYRRQGDTGDFEVAADTTRPEWTDTAAIPGNEYTYFVQTIAKAGEQKEAVSEPSEAVRITPVDHFAPGAPAGLRAVASPSTVELAWEHNNEPDLAGYSVYRAQGDGEFQKVAEAVEMPGYSDRTAESGKLYRYTVTAIDRTGNESPRSNAVEAALP
jgi:hypothetical protein